MSLSQTFNPKKVDPEVLSKIVDDLALRIRSVASPKRIILFGSAAEGRFVEGSDIDLILIFSDMESLLTGRKAIRSMGLLNKSIPVDLVFVTQDHYDLKKDLGGVCFIGEHEGRDL